MARPPKKLAQDTRQKTLEAALLLFADKGYFGASMRQIARAVGVRESALYHHFPSKQGILDALIKELGPGKVQRLGNLSLPEALDREGARLLLRTTARSLFEDMAKPDEQAFLRFMLREGARLEGAGVASPQAQFQKLRKSIAALFEELMRRKLVRRADPPTVALAFMGPMMALRMIHLVLASGPVDLRRLRKEVDAHVDFFWESVAP